MNWGGNMNIEVNLIAVLIAAILSMAVGFLWYGQLFGKQWMKLKGYTQENLKKEQKQMGKYYGLSFLLSLLAAYVLSHVITLSQNFFQQDLLTTGLTSAFWMWLGFVFTVQTTNTIFGDKKWKLLVIDTGYQLASLLVIGIVLSLWR